jgi:hypothetical protein
VEALSRRVLAREVVEALAVSLSSNESNFRFVVASAGSCVGLEAILVDETCRPVVVGLIGETERSALCTYLCLHDNSVV